jgi:cbb3-type cytochrome oxidase cytochrome c subunit
MRYGPLLFLAAFFALASSWCGLVLTPQLQIGQLQQTNIVGSAAAVYPVSRPGLARQGLEFYRANGCAYCHSQQVGQTATVLDIALTEAGTNQAVTAAALLNLVKDSADEPSKFVSLVALNPGMSNATAATLLTDLPKAFLRTAHPSAANAAVKTLNYTGAKAEARIVPLGPDIDRGWGKRRTVAEDFLFDSPVMPGSQRVGPDLADVGTRLPDLNWHLLHLYAPQVQVQGSSMPPYRFLFQKRKINGAPSSEALALPAALAPASGYEVVPSPAAKALAAYLVSLRIDAPLFVAPVSLAFAGVAAPTNAPAGSQPAATNTLPSNLPAR